MSSENEDEYGDALNASVLKRRKIQRACDICRRKKIRCDGPQAHNKCSNCIAYSVNCTYEEAAKKRGRPKGYVEALEVRVEKLEKLLKKICPDDAVLRDLYASMDPDATAHLTKMPASTSSEAFPSASHSSAHSPSMSTTEPTTTTILDLIHKIGSTVLVSQDDPFRDDDFEHVVLSERMKLLSIGAEEPRFFGKSSGAMFVQTAMEFKNEYAKDDPVKRKVLEGRRPAFWTRRTWENAILATPKLTYTFPPSDLMTELTNAYFENVNLFLPLLHRPTFERAIVDKLHLRDDSFAAVLLLVCAVASRYLDKIDERVLLDGVDSPHSAGWRWYVQVQVVKQNLLEPPTLYDLQSYCLAVEFLHGCFAPHSCWVLVGIGIRLAQDVGVHRRRVSREKLTVEDELWKRAFWVLVTMDRMASTGLGRPCAILDDDFDLDIPMECDDEFWEHPDPEQRFKQPAGIPSTVSAFNQQLRLNRIMAFALFTIYSIKTKFWESILQQWDQHIVTELDSALNKWISSLPEHLRWDPNQNDDRFFNLSAGLMSCYYHVQILIHRPFLRAKGKHSPLAFPSLAICTNAARSCSHVLELQLKRCNTVYPHMQICAVTAGIVLLLNMWGNKRSGVDTDPKEMKRIYKCMDILKKAEERWHPAGQLLDILSELASVGELIPPEEDPTLLANQVVKEMSSSTSNPMRTGELTDTLTSLINSTTTPFGMSESIDTSSSSLRGVNSQQSMQAMHGLSSSRSLISLDFAQSQLLSRSQSNVPLSNSDGRLDEQIAIASLPHGLTATSNWYPSLSSRDSGSGECIPSMEDVKYRQTQASQPVPEVYLESGVQPLPIYAPFGSDTITDYSRNTLASGYSSGDDHIATGTGLRTFPSQMYSNEVGTINQQQAIVESNTMAMWLNVPTGFEEMSIDPQEAIRAIRDMLPIIDPEEDYLTIVSAEEKIAAAESKRKKELEEAQGNLKALARVLEAARISSTRPSSVPSVEHHTSILNELDSSRLSLAKAISDVEGLVASKESELAILKEEARKLEEYDPAAEHEKELDGTALRLRIYKEMGFEPVLDTAGNLIKMIIKSRSGDIHAVDFTTGKSDFEYTQLLWKLAVS
ncbi:fungal-specific transcription factor domain-containing protein [Cyathus striatus]|nr:fungal-specific transcription factor domain-containing protein [Cyathus striatus]